MKKKKKQLAVVSGDSATRALAASAGLPVFATVPEYEAILVGGREEAPPTPPAGGFFFSSRRRHTSPLRDWSSDVCSSDLFGSRPAITRSSYSERSCAMPGWSRP